MSTYVVNFKVVPCVQGNGNSIDVINAAIRARGYLAQPFNAAGEFQSVPTWHSFSMDPAYIGLSYDEQWIMTNVSTPVTYSLLSGSLPSGFTLSSVSPAKGRISGTSFDALGNYTFTIRASNPLGYADQSFTITLNPIPVGGFILQ